MFIAPVVNAAGAMAHTVLIGSNPAVGSVISSLPDSISLKFADSLLNIPGKSINTVSVTDSMRMQIAQGAKTAGNTLTATLNETMKMAGDFLVAYRVVAQDGHVVIGSYKFTVDFSSKASTEKVKIISSGIRRYSISANGRNSLITGDPKGIANGDLVIDFSKDTLCYKITSNGLSNLTGAHLHAILSDNKVQSVQDEVIVGLNVQAIKDGVNYCQKVNSKFLSLIGGNPSHYFLMIHTQNYPDGAIGGVIKVGK
jgi:methionine-rich copper-binding protein CopC